MKMLQKSRGPIWFPLGLAAVLVSFLSALLALTLKHVTEHYESVFLSKSLDYKALFLILPFIGLSVIFFLRKYLFKNKQNKGIREVFDSVESGKPLPIYKIPSHFINGLLTVSFGGSTGIEVSTVVSTAAIGSLASTKESILRRYKKELLCAGTAAGITALFFSPIAGFLFVYEVIYKKFSTVFLFTVGIAVVLATAFSLLLHEGALFEVPIQPWHYHALPYFILLGIVAGLNSVYLTKCVLFFKDRFSRIKVPFHKVIIGSIVIGGALFFFPQLFGDGYAALEHQILISKSAPGLPLLFTLIAIMLLKPIITSITLSSGGDGGVFAPGIFIGAILGLVVSYIANVYFDANLVVLNFMAVGMAAVLSASINAPFTALFLVCGLIGDYTLLVPLCIGSFVSRYTAQRIFPFTVYSYR